MINNFPISTKINFRESVISIVDNIITNGYSIELDKELNTVIYSYYGLTEEEIRVVEGDKKIVSV